MSLLSFFDRNKHSSAGTAKARLQVAISSDRHSDSLPFLEDMRADIIKVIEKYTTAEGVQIHKVNANGIDTIEIEIPIHHNK